MFLSGGLMLQISINGAKVREFNGDSDILGAILLLHNIQCLAHIRLGGFSFIPELERADLQLC